MARNGQLAALACSVSVATAVMGARWRVPPHVGMVAWHSRHVVTSNTPVNEGAGVIGW